MDVSQAVRMLKRRRRQLIKDVVGADFKPSQGDNTRARAIAWTAPAAALAPNSDHPGGSRSRLDL